MIHDHVSMEVRKTWVRHEGKEPNRRGRTVPIRKKRSKEA